jgi:hypothetical protein
MKQFKQELNLGVVIPPLEGKRVKSLLWKSLLASWV